MNDKQQDFRANSADNEAVSDAKEAGSANVSDKPVVYESREKLDGELMCAISDILSAEQEAARIIAKASESVKAIQQDGATRERDMKEQNNKTIAAAHDKAIADATARADTERNRRIEKAKADGENLLLSKQKEIEKTAKELYVSIGGKG